MSTCDVPRSLSRMIEEAREWVARAESEGALAIRDEEIDGFFIALSRGEYPRDLYWRCVAEDCEEATDWEGAKDAYRQLLGEPEPSQLDRCRALDALGDLHRLLGEFEPAIESYRSATEAAAADGCEVLQRITRCREAWALLGLGRTDEARTAVRRGRSLRTGIADLLGDARLLIASAACDVAEGHRWWAAWNLSRASRQLSILEVRDGLSEAPGVLAARASWWIVSAKRHRLKGAVRSEIRALEEAIRIRRLLCEDPIGCSVYGQVILMRCLFALADALRRGDRIEESHSKAEEADGIRCLWRLPESVYAKDLP